jgi:hypothetical protein
MDCTTTGPIPGQYGHFLLSTPTPSIFSHRSAISSRLSAWIPVFIKLGSPPVIQDSAIQVLSFPSSQNPLVPSLSFLRCRWPKGTFRNTSNYADAELPLDRGWLQIPFLFVIPCQTPVTPPSAHKVVVVAPALRWLPLALHGWGS